MGVTGFAFVSGSGCPRPGTHAWQGGGRSSSSTATCRSPARSGEVRKTRRARTCPLDTRVPAWPESRDRSQPRQSCLDLPGGLLGLLPGPDPGQRLGESMSATERGSASENGAGASSQPSGATPKRLASIATKILAFSSPKPGRARTRANSVGARRRVRPHASRRRRRTRRRASGTARGCACPSSPGTGAGRASRWNTATTSSSGIAAIAVASSVPPRRSLRRGRPAERPLHRHLLVEQHADHEGERILDEQPIGLGVAGDGERLDGRGIVRRGRRLRRHARRVRAYAPSHASLGAPREPVGPRGRRPDRSRVARRRCSATARCPAAPRSPRSSRRWAGDCWWFEADDGSQVHLSPNPEHAIVSRRAHRDPPRRRPRPRASAGSRAAGFENRTIGVRRRASRVRDRPRRQPLGARRPVDLRPPPFELCRQTHSALVVTPEVDGARSGQVLLV